MELYGEKVYTKVPSYIRTISNKRHQMKDSIATKQATTHVTCNSHPCHYCKKIYGSRIFLFSHLGIHNRNHKKRYAPNLMRFWHCNFKIWLWLMFGQLLRFDRGTTLKFKKNLKNWFSYSEDFRMFRFRFKQHSLCIMNTNCPRGVWCNFPFIFHFLKIAIFLARNRCWSVR